MKNYKAEIKENIRSVERIASGDWLHIDKISFNDSAGINRHWESVGRNKAKGAVAIIAVLKPSDRIILVSQFRPPASGKVIEFPAGLIDREEELEETALRELREETGYLGRIIRVSPPSFSSPGLSSETVFIAFAEVDENSEENMTPLPRPDEGECIETILVPIANLCEFLLKSHTNGARLDSKLLSFSIGISHF